MLSGAQKPATGDDEPLHEEVARLRSMHVATEERLKATSERFALLSETANRLLAALNPQEVIQELCEKVTAFLRCDVFFNYLLERGRLRLNAYGGVPVEDAEKILHLDPGAAVCGCAARDRRAILVEDGQHCADEKACLVRSFGVRAYCCHPLMVGGKAIGTLSFGSKSQNSFSADQVELMRAVSDQVTLALQRIRSEEAKAAMEESEERYRQFVKASSLVDWVTNARGEVEEQNRSWCEFTGQTFDEARGFGWMNAIHPEDRPKVVEAWQLASTSKRNYETEYRLKINDGSWLEISARGAPILNDDGSVRVWIGTCIDITERKRAKEALQKANRTLRALSHSNQAVMLAKDERQYVREICEIIVNDCGHRLAWVGYAREDEDRTVEPIAWAGDDSGYVQTARISWADTERGRGPTGTAIRTGSIFLCNDLVDDPRFAPWREEALKRGFASSITLPLLRHGRAFGALMIYSNMPAAFSEEEITLLDELSRNLAQGIIMLRLRIDQKRAEEALRLSEEKFAVAFANNPAAICMSRLEDGTFLEVNDTWIRLTGHSRDEAVGYKSTSLRFWPRLADRTRFIDELCKNGSINGWEQKLVRKSGEVFYSKLSAQILQVGGEDIILATFIDISDLKSARDAAEKASEAKDRFIATLSHELRTPLTPILAATQILDRRGNFEPWAAEYLSVIKRNATLEARLIDDLLDLNRIVHGKIVLSKTIVSLHELIRRAVETCRASAQEKSIEIRLVLEAADCHINADAGRIQQIFWNLISNAIKFTPQGGKIEIRTLNRDGTIEATVTDNGKGIDPEKQEKIFDAFEQGGSDVTIAFGGLGLGLAICKRLTRLHGGTITAESAGPGRGSTFTVNLALGRQPGTTPDSAKTGKEKVPLRGRVLLVEDHEDTALMMQHMLEWNGLDVVRAGDVASAIACARRETFDLMLCDVGLPDGNGLDVMKAIGGQNLRAIALTGRGMESDIKACKEAGFLHHLTKPVDFERLEGIVKGLLPPS